MSATLHRTEGWQLVPVEPTPEMMDAAWDHTPLNMDDMTDGDFGRAYKDMLAAAPSGWQAIETAPKDGTAVLVYQKIDNGHWLITPAYFAGGHWLIVCFHDGNVEYEIAPTHWQPIPLPPAPNQGEAS